MPGVCRTGPRFRRGSGVYGECGRGRAASRADYQNSVRRAVDQVEARALWPGRFPPAVAQSGLAAAFCDERLYDGALVFDAVEVPAHAATEAQRREPYRTVGHARQQRAPRLGTQREVLRKPESGLPDSNAAARMAATGR